MCYVKIKIMKKVIILLLVLTLGCDKLTRHCGDTTMDKNGVSWSGTNVAYNRDNTGFKSFSLDSRAEISTSRVEKLDIFKIPCKEGTFYLSKTNAIINDSLTGAGLTRTLEGDQLIGGWSLPEEPDSSNYIQVTFYDECNGRVEGYFNCTLMGYTLEPYDTIVLDTIHLTNGWFEAKIDNEW